MFVAADRRYCKQGHVIIAILWPHLSNKESINSGTKGIKGDITMDPELGQEFMLFKNV